MNDSPQPTPDLFGARVDYSQRLNEADLAATPLEQFLGWYAEAEASDLIVEPQAMIVSTTGSEGPTSRTVLCKEITPMGFAFASNYDSRKGQDLQHDPRISVLFPWHALQRQVIVRGVAERATDAASAAYFSQRPVKSQISAVISEQSREIASRADLEERWRVYEADLESAGRQPQRPPHWGLYIVRPVYIEFWAGSRSRLHDRLVYTAQEADRGADQGAICEFPPMDDARAWGMHRLQP